MGIITTARAAGAYALQDCKVYNNNNAIYKAILNSGLFFESHRVEPKISRVSKDCQIKSFWQSK